MTFLLRSIWLAAAVLACAVTGSAIAQTSPTRDEIIDALSPKASAEPEERTRSFRTRGLHNVDPSRLTAPPPPPAVKEVSDNEITFHTGSWELTEDAKQKLRDKYASAIKVVAERVRSNKVERQILLVAGHTDKRGSHEYNDDLSMKRAKAVVEFLKDELNKGLAPGQTSNVHVQLDYKGCGKRFPKDDREGDVLVNRRVVIKNITNLADAQECVQQARQ